MTWVIIASLVIGILSGLWLLPADMMHLMDNYSTAALVILIFCVGIELGHNRAIWRKLYDMGWRIILVPVFIALGSLSGALIMGFMLHYAPYESLAVGAGFGWYSLSGVLIDRLYSTQLGVVAFLTNVWREVLTFIILPFIGKYFTKLLTVAPGGATTMDTTLPLVLRYGGKEIAAIGFLSGVILSMLVPFLVPLMLQVGR